MKRNQIKLASIVIIISLLCIFAVAANAGVNIISGQYGSEVLSQVFDGGSTINSDILYPEGSSWSGTTYIDNGLEFSTTNHNLTGSSFKIEFEHIGNSTSLTWPSNRARQQYANSSGGIRFSVDAESPYSIIGEYNTEGNRQAQFWVWLTDTYGGRYFKNSQISRYRSENHLVIGESTGDVLNELTGSLTGTLYPGIEYSLTYGAMIDNNGPAPEWVDEATANGFITIYVPEPATLCLLAIGALAIRRKHR